MSELVKTGIDGLDAMLGGGVPKSYIVLIAGGPGSGKSTLAMQILYNGATKYNEPGIYITLEETAEEIKNNFSSYGWDLSKIEIISLIPEKLKTIEGSKYVLPSKITTGEGEEYTMKSFSIDFIEEIIKRKVEEKGAKRLVLDSISSLASQINDAFLIRHEILNLRSMLRRLGTTSLLITEMPEEGGSISRFGIEEFVAHGVITVYNIRKGSKRARGLEILKMRGVKHSQNISMIEIKENGMVVYPEENLF